MNEIIICAPDHEKKYKFTRDTGRGIIIKGNMVLMSHERIPDCWSSPGGGREGDESFNTCCEREVLEETGLIVEAKEHFATVTEYYDEACNTHQYFLCEIMGEGKPSYTQGEISVDAKPEWININDLLLRLEKDIHTEGGNHRVHLREHTVLTEYLKRYN